MLFLCAKLCRDSDSAMLRPKGQVAAVGQVKLGVTQVLPTAVLNPHTTFCPAALHLAGSSTSGQRPQPSSLPPVEQTLEFRHGCGRSKVFKDRLTGPGALASAGITPAFALEYDVAHTQTTSTHPTRGNPTSNLKHGIGVRRITNYCQAMSHDNPDIFMQEPALQTG